MVGSCLFGCGARTQENFNGFGEPRIRRGGAVAVARFHQCRNLAAQARLEADHYMAVEADDVVLVGELEAGIVAMCLKPGGDVQTRIGVQVQLTAARVEGEARQYANLVIWRVDADVESACDAFLMKRRVVQPSLAAMIGLLCFEVRYTEQHSEVVVRRMKRRERTVAHVVHRAGVRFHSYHLYAPSPSPRSPIARRWGLLLVSKSS